jgi:hypothetical protein
LTSRLVKIFLHLFLAALLTALTQVGGAVYLFVLIITPYFVKRFRTIKPVLLILICFITIYSVVSLAIIPFVAPMFGLVALPVTGGKSLRPLNVLTVILNRHYVTPALKENICLVAKEMQEKYPGSVVRYLDANFPFYAGFPLLPHLSHNDGRKLDLAFFYEKEGTPSDRHPSWLGYGVCEEPRHGETNTASMCKAKGHWQYSALKYFVASSSYKTFTFDQDRTKALLIFLIQNRKIQKIFLEPHLKKRLGLKSEKIGFHGCHAVRHDDHIHVQL